MEIKQLTFTRFIAAFIIILFHYGQSAIPFDSGLLGHFAKEAAFSVSYFFCLSGYILTHVYYSKNNFQISKRSFYIKRFARIYPIYIIGFLFALISGVYLYNAIPKGNSIILQLLGLHAWTPGLALEINYPGWSISVELLFYLSFPFLLKLLGKLSNVKLIVFTSSFWIISGITHILLVVYGPENNFQWGEFILYNPLFHINAFVLGVSACIILKRFKDSTKISSALSTGIFFISCFILFMIIATDNIILPWGHNGLFAPIFILIIVSLQMNTGIISKLFSLKPLIFLGEISFGMYILQHPIRMWFEEATRNVALSKSASFYMFLSVLIIFSSITYLLIEKPVRKRIVNLKNPAP